MVDTPSVALYVVPADTPSHRNLGEASAKAINSAILRFEQLFHQAAREDEFMAGPPATFKSILDEAKASTAPYLLLEEVVGLFAKYLLSETHTRRLGGEDKALAADTVSTKIRMVALEFVWGLNRIQPTDASYDSWVKWLNELVKNFKDCYNKDNESPTADAVSTLQTLPLFGVIEPNAGLLSS
jgi:hypothetical protein